MSTALVGLFGVIAGAVVTGGVQSASAWFDRRLSARSSARLLYMHLHEAQQAIDDLRERQSWEEMITDWTSFGAAWERHCEALARVLRTKDFLLVSSAFACLASLVRARLKDADDPVPSGAPPNYTVPDGMLERYRAHVQAAKRPILEAAFTRREKRKGDHLSALEIEAEVG
jgi:hypothetical protein